MALKTRYKIIGFVGAAVLVVGGLYGAMQSGLIPKPAGMASFIPEKVSIQNIAIKDVPTATYDLAKAPQAGFNGCVRMLSIPWNGASAINLANGDTQTTNDSLVKQYSGGCLTLERQDDYSQMQNEMVKFAQGVANGDANPQGAAFTVIMGDGYPAFAASLKPQFDKLNQKFAVIGVAGFSNGEDKCMAPPTNGDPNNARGDVIAAVARDGDQNICMKWASDNNIPVNTDNTVYDPKALNFVDTGSFTEADDKFIAGYCETRIVVKDGIKTKESKNVCVNGVATWTPGDVTVVQKKGGIVSLASTKEYNQQMPTVIIGNVAWMKKNQAFVVGLLRAVDRASFQIRTTPDGLRKASVVNAAVWGAGGGDEADPAYWSKYFVGFTEKDSQGNSVPLGGSRVVTASEAADFLGLTNGSYNVYKGVYTVFGKYNTTMYPNDVPSVPNYDDVVDTSFLSAALAGANIQRTASTQFAEHKTATTVVSQKAVSIEFETGSAKISPKSMETLYSIADNAAMTNLLIRVDGHTDNTGNSDANLSLSRARAQAVADWLNAQSPTDFPKNRLTVRGYGDTTPVASNDTADGRAQNRRVVITFGSAE